MADQNKDIVLYVAAVVMGAVLALYAFPQPPRVMAVEFEDNRGYMVSWASAVLEGNEIVPRLVRMSPNSEGWFRPQEGRGRLKGVTLYPPPLSSKQMGCWGVVYTAEEPKGWRERLSPQQAREFEDIYCSAVLTMGTRELVGCAMMRDGELICD